MTKKNICPLREERFEIRTGTLGCGCSATTLLSVIVTVFATIVALLILYGIGIGLTRINNTIGSGTWRGVEVERKDDGSRVERQWRRGNWTKSIRSAIGGPKPDPYKSEQEQVTERTRLLG